MPETIAEVWELQLAPDAKYDDLANWNDELDRQNQGPGRPAPPECWIPQIHQPQFLQKDEMEAVTKVAPFAREKWF